MERLEPLRNEIIIELEVRNLVRFLRNFRKFDMWISAMLYWL